MSLSYALLLARATTGLAYGDLAADPALRRSFEFLAATQTPVDPRCGFCLLPTIGHVTSYG